MNFVFDLDGTVCFDGKQIPEVIEKVLISEILNNQNHQLIFASARPVRDMLPVLRQEFQQGYLIGGNGSIVFFRGKQYDVQPIAGKTYQEILTYIKNKQLDYLVDEAWDYAIYGEHLTEIRKRLDVLKLARKIPLHQIEKPIKLILGNYVNQQEILIYLDTLPINVVVYEKEKCMDISARGINKSHALKRILGAEPYIAFGNDHNDLEMLREAAVSIAIGDNFNAKESAKEHLPAIPELIARKIKELATD